MRGRTIQTASVLFLLTLLFVPAVALWDRTSTFFATATERIGDRTLHISFAGESSNQRTALSGTCNDDAALFAYCEAPVAQPFQPAIPAILESPAMMPSVSFAELPNTVDTGLPPYSCFALIDVNRTDNVENNVSPSAASCCGKVEDAASGVAGVGPGTTGCSCGTDSCMCG